MTTMNTLPAPVSSSSVRATDLLFRGNDILKARTEVLQAFAPAALAAEIRGSEVLKAEVERLRKVQQLDKQAYTRLKTRLPFFCCALFRNGLRHGEHFEAVRFFVLDVDKLPGREIMDEKRTLIQADERVVLLFTSPGGRGFKVLFRLAEPCTSLKAFSDFYRTFCFRFSEEYGLSGYLDTATCDATRVCFLSYDPLAHYFPLALDVAMGDYVSAMNLLSQEALNPAAVADGQDAPWAEQGGEEPKPEKPALPEAVYNDIKGILKPMAMQRKPVQAPVYVPEVLQALREPVANLCSRASLEVREVREIQYGLKFTFGRGAAFAELNVFHGRNGFSVMATTKRGSDAALAALCVQLVEQVIYA